MFTHEKNLYAFMFGYARLLVGDVPDERMAEQPAGLANHPAWTLGHLCAAADLGLRLLGAPTLCSPEWMALFGRGSEPAADRGRYPAKPALLAALENAHGKLTAAALAADPAAVAGVNPVERNRAAFPTLGDLVAHLMTTHTATHLGQLSAWRRAAGLKSVLG